MVNYPDIGIRPALQGRIEVIPKNNRVPGNIAQSLSTGEHNARASNHRHQAIHRTPPLAAGFVGPPVKPLRQNACKMTALDTHRSAAGAIEYVGRRGVRMPQTARKRELFGCHITRQRSFVPALSAGLTSGNRATIGERLSVGTSTRGRLACPRVRGHAASSGWRAGKADNSHANLHACIAPGKRGRETGKGDTAYALDWMVTERYWAKPKEGGGMGR